jgi:hypothetical protein
MLMSIGTLTRRLLSSSYRYRNTSAALIDPLSAFFAQRISS